MKKNEFLFDYETVELSAQEENTDYDDKLDNSLDLDEVDEDTVSDYDEDNASTSHDEDDTQEETPFTLAVNDIETTFWDFTYLVNKYKVKGTKSALKKARVLATKLSKQLKEFRKVTKELI